MAVDFEAIRPYHDHEVAPVLQRLLRDEAFLQTLARYRFARLTDYCAPLLRRLIAWRLGREVRGIDSVAALQDRIEPYVDSVIERATAGISYSGLEQLDDQKAYLYLANHRDIVMDPAFVNYAVYHAGLPTPRIAIGDNLLQKPFVSDLMRLNKSFIVHRSITNRREKLSAFQTLSAYINHSIATGHSIWIAQAEGRAKDGNDATDAAILKMFHMSRKDQPFAEVIGSLNLVPVSISYEYDPCDVAKARELEIRARTGSYHKQAGEDDRSIALGITGHKGRVHLAFNRLNGADYADAKALAQACDQLILANYRLFPVHYLAWEQWAERDLALPVPSATSLFSASELATAKQELARRLAQCSAAEKPFLLMQYATPVRNQYRLKQNA